MNLQKQISWVLLTAGLLLIGIKTFASHYAPAANDIDLASPAPKLTFRTN
jgi:hypothetical protein